jgi:GTP-binding protein
VDDRFVLVDLPGYGYAKAPVEAAQQWRRNTRGYIAGAQGLRGVILLLDIRREPSPDDRQFAELVRSAGRRLLPVVTKCDKVGRGKRHERLGIIAEILGVIPAEFTVTSAKTGEGRTELWQNVLRLIDEC